MSSEITRVTMVKFENEEQIPIALQGFEAFTKAQQRNGSPYILSMEAGLAYGHVRDQGYNFVAKSVFKNKDDMEYYEKECPGHEGFKVFLKENARILGLMTVYFTPGISYKI